MKRPPTLWLYKLPVYFIFWGNRQNEHWGSSVTGYHLAGDLFVAQKGNAEELRSCLGGARSLGRLWHLALLGVSGAGGQTGSGRGARGGGGAPDPRPVNGP